MVTTRWRGGPWPVMSPGELMQRLASLVGEVRDSGNRLIANAPHYSAAACIRPVALRL